MTHFHRSSLVLCALAALACTGPARGQTDCPEHPDYRNLRYEENWRYLADPTCADGMFDRLKFLPLDETRQRYLSLGGEARLISARDGLNTRQSFEGLRAFGRAGHGRALYARSALVGNDRRLGLQLGGRHPARRVRRAAGARLVLRVGYRLFTGEKAHDPAPGVALRCNQRRPRPKRRRAQHLQFAVCVDRVLRVTAWTTFRF